jgi:cell wall-associated NlpC family hydrolase
MYRSALAAIVLLLASSAEAGVTIVHLSPLDLQGAKIEGLTPLPFDKGLLQGAGRLQSNVIEAMVPFDDLVGSWNADVPKGAAVEMQAQARQDGHWTKWYRLSVWAPGAPSSFERQEDADGYVDVDTLKLKRKADALRYRILMTAKGARHAHLKRIAVAYTDSKSKYVPSPAFTPGPWVREIKLTSRSQRTEDKSISSDICSPTSLAMVLDLWGVNLKTAALAERVRDQRADIYGNWPINIAAAADLGLSGHVARLSSLLDLQNEIAVGHPVIVSISFKPGELTGAPIKKTRGHLFVVTGFTKSGDVIVRDPAAPNAKSVRRVYKRQQFDRAWLRNKLGLSYILAKRFPEELMVGVPSTDLRSTPKFPRKPSTDDPGLSSQALYGETVRVIDAQGDWVRVEALEQPHPGRAGEWVGYPGWMRADALRKPPQPFIPNAVVRIKRASLRWEDSAGSEESLTLPMGALVHVEPPFGPNWTVRLISGRPARAQSGALRLLSHSSSVERRDVIESAAAFLGDLYVWGGRSSLQRQPGWGVDCSGLVHLAYRSVGLMVPRDAHHQFLEAKPIRRRQLKPGDLVFLTQSARTKRVDHVLMYTGGDELIESRVSAGKTVRTTFAERFGVPLSEIESGEIVPDISKRRVTRRRISFGTFLGSK